MKNVILIGYSGHAYVVYDALLSSGHSVRAYAETEEKKSNPFQLHFLGNEMDEAVLEKIKSSNYFVAIGDNSLRLKITEKIIARIGIQPINAIHPKAIFSSTSSFGKGILFAPGCIINPLAKIGNGVICNSGCIIEHECVVGDFVHVAPGAVLCGNVSVGENTFIGANSVIREGISIGKNVIIGAGTVITKNISDGLKVVGNPFRIIKK